MSYSSGSFSIDDIGFIQTAAASVLAAVARGDIDLNRIAKEELANRSLDVNGAWVGFAKAKELHQV